MSGDTPAIVVRNTNEPLDFARQISSWERFFQRFEKRNSVIALLLDVERERLPAAS